MLCSLFLYEFISSWSVVPSVPSPSATPRVGGDQQHCPGPVLGGTENLWVLCRPPALLCFWRPPQSEQRGLNLQPPGVWMAPREVGLSAAFVLPQPCGVTIRALSAGPCMWWDSRDRETPLWGKKEGRENLSREVKWLYALCPWTLGHGVKDEQSWNTKVLSGEQSSRPAREWMTWERGESARVAWCSHGEERGDLPPAPLAGLWA